MSDKNENLQLIIENICLTGCERVNEIIGILDRHESIEETRKLSRQESNIVLQELKMVMSVYKE